MSCSDSHLKTQGIVNIISCVLQKLYNPFVNDWSKIIISVQIWLWSRPPVVLQEVDLVCFEQHLCCYSTYTKRLVKKKSFFFGVSDISKYIKGYIVFSIKIFIYFFWQKYLPVIIWKLLYQDVGWFGGLNRITGWFVILILGAIRKNVVNILNIKQNAWKLACQFKKIFLFPLMHLVLYSQLWL